LQRQENESQDDGKVKFHDEQTSTTRGALWERGGYYRTTFGGKRARPCIRGIGWRR
jgi:hypothetical protein